MERITTLIPPRDPKTTSVRTLPRLNTDDKSWTVCRKLGAYLLADTTPDTRMAARWLLETDDPTPVSPDPDTTVGRLAATCTSVTDIWASPDTGDIAMIARGAMPRRLIGDITWRDRHTGERIRVIGCRLPVLAGAIELVDDARVDAVYEGTTGARLHHDARQMIMGIIDEHWDLPDMRMAVMGAARDRWPLEERVQLNARWRARRIAGVFDDKKRCDDAHREAAAGSVFARMYAHVEIDQSVDLDLFARLCDEYKRLTIMHAIPSIDRGNAFRFRLTGRHKAIGVYHPVRRAIAVDPRHPESTWHELSHAWDMEHGWVSLSETFRPVLDAYLAHLDTSAMSDARRKYAVTPAEVLARCSEWFAVQRGLGGSFVPERLDGPLYEPFRVMGDVACEWAARAGLVGVGSDTVRKPAVEAAC